MMMMMMILIIVIPDLAINSFPSAVPGQVHTEQSPDSENIHLNAHHYIENNYKDKSTSTRQHICHHIHPVQL